MSEMAVVTVEVWQGKPRTRQRKLLKKFPVLDESILAELNPPNAAFCVRFVADRYRVPLIELASERKFQRLTQARAVVFYALRRLTYLSYPRIGEQLRRDHTTVISALRKLRSRMRRNNALEAEVCRVVGDCQRAWAAHQQASEVRP